MSSRRLRPAPAAQAPGGGGSGGGGARGNRPPPGAGPGLPPLPPLPDPSQTGQGPAADLGMPLELQPLAGNEDFFDSATGWDFPALDDDAIASRKAGSRDADALAPMGGLDAEAALAGSHPGAIAAAAAPAEESLLPDPFADDGLSAAERDSSFEFGLEEGASGAAMVESAAALTLPDLSTLARRQDLSAQSGVDLEAFPQTQATTTPPSSPAVSQARAAVPPQAPSEPSSTAAVRTTSRLRAVVAPPPLPPVPDLPGDPDGALALGRSLLNDDRIEDGVGILEQATRAHPSDTRISTWFEYAERRLAGKLCPDARVDRVPYLVHASQDILPVSGPEQQQVIVQVDGRRSLLSIRRALPHLPAQAFWKAVARLRQRDWIRWRDELPAERR